MGHPLKNQYKIILGGAVLLGMVSPLSLFAQMPELVAPVEQSREVVGENLEAQALPVDPVDDILLDIENDIGDVDAEIDALLDMPEITDEVEESIAVTPDAEVPQPTAEAVVTENIQQDATAENMVQKEPLVDTSVIAEQVKEESMPGDQSLAPHEQLRRNLDAFLSGKTEIPAADNNASSPAETENVKAINQAAENVEQETVAIDTVPVEAEEEVAETIEELSEDELIADILDGEEDLLGLEADLLAIDDEISESLPEEKSSEPAEVAAPVPTTTLEEQEPTTPVAAAPTVEDIPEPLDLDIDAEIANIESELIDDTLVESVPEASVVNKDAETVPLVEKTISKQNTAKETPVAPKKEVKKTPRKPIDVVKDAAKKEKEKREAPASRHSIERERMLFVKDARKVEENNEEDDIKDQEFDLEVVESSKKEKKFQTDEQLEMAYEAILAGQVEAAINIYKGVLDKEHNNKTALFGLATSYQRNKQYDQAKAIYTELLDTYPEDREAMNNFMLLIAEDEPEKALESLKKIEEVNQSFSPVLAQIGMVHLKLNDLEQAKQYLEKAIKIDRNNVSYLYNYAVILDQLGQRRDAIYAYTSVVNRVNAGAIINGSIESIIKRLNYLKAQK